MDRVSNPARLMIVSDLDHKMVDHHDSEKLSLVKFNALWEANYDMIRNLRSPTLYKQLRKEKPMLTPVITIMSVGTEKRTQRRGNNDVYQDHNNDNPSKAINIPKR